MQRPDLSQVDPQVVAYIEYLERKIGVRASANTVSSARESLEAAAPERSDPLPVERETTAGILTITQEGIAKRTLRHIYTRQHRGGMGVFGIDLMGDDQPTALLNVEANENLLFFSNHARVFRVPFSQFMDDEINARGSSFLSKVILERDEHIIAALPEQARGYVALATESGRVRCLRHHLFGEHMKPGAAMFNFNEVGALASVCWTTGEGELFMVTQQGVGIRFAEKSISPQGDQGVRLTGEDRVVAIVPVDEDSGVFMITSDGRGTIRQMRGFAANKTPGGSGKIAMKTSRLVGAVTVEGNDDLFVISQLGKAVRFPSDEVPMTEGVVQGVNCMGLRGDEVARVVRGGPFF